MVDFLIAPANVPFAVALSLLCAFFIIELVGFMFGADFSALLGETGIPDLDVPAVDIDVPLPEAGVDLDVGVATKFLYWLKIGRVPLIILIVIFMTAFVLCGYGLQLILLWAAGFMLPSYLAGACALILCIPVVRLTGGAIARVIPKDETAAIPLIELVGSRAVITIGAARKAFPAQARATDRFGTTHYLMVEPDRNDEELTAGQALLLVRYDGRRFYAIPHPEAETI